MFPVTPEGSSLGERHRHLSRLVQEAYGQRASLPALLLLPEQSHLDRLLKIDLASKYRDVDYIIANLKHEDLLYVSRCLKCTWLLASQYAHIIHPTYLEETLYPRMSTTAANKMKHWIQTHLRDPLRCQLFYEYYVTKNFKFASNFLWHCSKDFVISEVANVPDRLTPYYLKRILERHPEFSKTFFELIKSNKSLLSDYMYHQGQYFKSISVILKSDTDLFLDIIEEYFNENAYTRFNAGATKFIMKKRKCRFLNKPELYMMLFLQVETVAKYLSSDEIKLILLKLARAEYLEHWFSYKNVEPLFKRLMVEDRENLKKQIFVEKSVGDKVKDWPYQLPSAPEFFEDYPSSSIFYDSEYSPLEYDYDRQKRRKIMKRCMKSKNYFDFVVSEVSTLDQMYKRFRFTGFSRTFFELRQEMPAASSVEMRMQMMLVLVSKTGGRENRVAELLGYLVGRHGNEPAHLRASVVRSFVKRASVWRVMPETWQLFIQFARGLGLDGAQPEVPCCEGLHAVVLRNIFASSECSPTIFDAFLNNFSNLANYKLNSKEKSVVARGLPILLLRAASNTPEPEDAAKFLTKLFDVLDAYRTRLVDCPTALSAVKDVAQKDMAAAESLLRRLYGARVARKMFTSENFDLNQSNESYLNALKHAPELLMTEKFEDLIPNKLRHDGFLRKLSIYFYENGGLAERYLGMIEKSINNKPDVRVSRSLAILAGSTFPIKLQQFESNPVGTVEKKIANTLIANGHLAIPRLDLDVYGWRKAGLVAVANKTSVCRATDIPLYVKKLSTWPRSYKLMWKLAKRAGLESEAFALISKSRPILAVRVGLPYVQEVGDKVDITMWESLKSIIRSLDLKKHDKLSKSLSHVDLMPPRIMAEYACVIFDVFKNVSLKKAMPILCHIENILPEVNEEFLGGVIRHFLSEKFTLENISSDHQTKKTIKLYVRVIAKYMLACRTKEEQERRIAECEPFFEHVKQFWAKGNAKEDVEGIIKYYLSALKYSRVYLDSSFVSCLPVLQNVQIWLEGFLPIDRYLGLHIQVGLMISYFNSVRQSVELYPEVFLDRPKREDEGVILVGAEFGKCLSNNAVELAEKSFVSVVQLYAAQVVAFLNDEFNSGRDIKPLLNTILKEIFICSSDTHSLILGVLIFAAMKYTVGNNYEISNLIKKIVDPQVLFLIYANNINCSD